MASPARLLTRLLPLLLPLAACSSSDDSGNTGSTGTAGGASGAGGQGGGASGGGGSAQAGSSQAGSSQAGSSQAGSGGSGGQAGGGPSCSDTPLLPDADTGFLVCNQGPTHRPEVKACPSKLPTTGGPCEQSGLPPDPGTCQKDADCKDSPNGYCAANSGGAFICACHYGCTVDADCKAGQLCLCGASIGVCVATACARDADCGAGSLCLSYTIDGGCSSGTSFACTTAQDQCVTDKDCNPGGGFGGQVCGHDGTRRLCVPGPQACPGRPLRVDGLLRAAALRAGGWG